MQVVELIAAKRDGHAIASGDLHDLIAAYSAKEVPDYQMAAFLMAGYLRGFSHDETVALTTPWSSPATGSTSQGSVGRRSTSIPPVGWATAPPWLSPL